MKLQPGEKHIVNTASLAGLIPMSGHTAYSSSKAAVIALTEAMAPELAPHGFGVTIFCPSRVPTNLQKNSALLTADKFGAEQRSFEPVATPQAERNATFALDSVEPVGAMVRNAILDNTLYLHTNIVPSDLVAEHIYLQYGSSTIGKRYVNERPHGLRGSFDRPMQVWDRLDHVVYSPPARGRNDPQTSLIADQHRLGLGISVDRLGAIFTSQS